MIEHGADVLLRLRIAFDDDVGLPEVRPCLVMPLPEPVVAFEQLEEGEPFGLVACVGYDVGGEDVSHKTEMEGVALVEMTGECHAICAGCGVFNEHGFVGGSLCRCIGEEESGGGGKGMSAGGRLRGRGEQVVYGVFLNKRATVVLDTREKGMRFG